MRTSILLSLAILVACSSKPKAQKQNTCLASREYITTMEYLREQKDFSLNEKDARALADKVSSGCTNASKRFIHVTNLLVKSGLPTQNAIKTGLKYALSDDESYSAFMTIFKSSYLGSLLDLDLKLSLDIATDLSDSSKGNMKLAQKNFNHLVEFCIDRKSLDLPLVECARTAARVVKSGANYDFKISEDFIDTFNFLTESNKANQPTFKALEVAEYVVKFGPEAKSSFIKSYEYGVAKKGLDIPISDAIEFGKTMASRSIKKEDKEN